jgi:hypothetical protein
MPNAIKYNVSSETLALKRGNFYIGTGDVGKGPTSSTGYYNGITPASGGYTVYLNKESGGPSIYTVSTDGELISLTNNIAGASYSTTAQCLSYYMSQTDKMCFNLDYESITTNGLVLNLDAGFTPSYPRNDSYWYDSSVSASNSTLVNGITFNSECKGNLVFDGVDDNATIYVPGLSTVATVEMWCKIGVGYSGKMFCGWQGYDVYCADGSIGYNTGNGDVYGINSATVSSLKIVDTWAHYVFEFRSDVSYTNNKIYINGVQQSLSQILSSESAGGRNFNNGYGRIATWGYGGYYMPMNCGVFRVYNRSLSSDEVVKNYNAQKGRYVNFYTNGNFQFGNFNFTSGVANSDVTLDGATYSLQLPQQQYSTFTSDNFVEVDTTKNYQMTVYTRTLTKGGPGNDVLSGGHTGFATFDSSGRFIDLRQCGGVANTVLTRTLNAGDTYAYVSSENNQWVGPNNTYYFRHFMIYPPTHPEFNTKWTYTRIGFGDVDIYYNEITDIGGGELRFRFADASGNWVTFPDIGYPTPAGTGVMNGVAGGTYSYVFYPTTGAYGSWSEYVSDIFTGENRNSSTPFRYGTKYILFMHLINYAVPGGTSPLPVMLFGKTELKQII